MRGTFFACLAAASALCLISNHARADDKGIAADAIGCGPGKGGFDFSLRAGFSDLGPETCVHSLVSSRGAAVSATFNQQTGQYSSGIDGLAAFVYRYYGDGDFGYSMGAYVQGNDTYQFDPTRTQAINGDSVTPGAFGEVFFTDPSGLLIHDLRVRGGEIVSSTGTRSDTVVAEWFPTYHSDNFRYGNIGLPVEIGSSALWYTFSPEIMVQYDRYETGPNGAAIFSSRDDAARIGPQLVFLFSIDKNSLPKGAEFIGNMSLQVTTHESWDTLSHRGYTWSSLALNYTIPGTNKQPSHFGLSATYGLGNAEGSGNKTSQIKLGLTAKY
ncbi:hypothetical protein [Bradyrhizobium genosp. A]|uniref:hypothetical protein n=1 Tax=Bradyrhizobium genosp. A TaxID=83626 RepID=UPI003CF42088